MMIRPLLLVLLAQQAFGFGIAPAISPWTRAAHRPASMQARSRSRLGLRASASTAAKGSGFDAEQAALYSKIADSHRHPQGPWKVMLEIVQEAVTQAAVSDPAILDLASGPGEPAATIARAMPTASVTSTDLSPDMVATAAKVAATLPNMKAEVADMEQLNQFADGSLDVVTCCYGFMFPPDKDKAVSECFRVLKKGGTLVATTWNEASMLKLLSALMADILGKPAPPPPQNPLALAEPGLFESMLEKAGFENIQTSTSSYPFDMTDDEDTQFKLCTLLVKDKLKELQAEEKARKFFDEKIGEFSEVDARGHRMLTGNTFKLTVARKP